MSRGSKRLEKALKLIGSTMTDSNGDLSRARTDQGAAERDVRLSTGEIALVSKALAEQKASAMNVLINATGGYDDLADKLKNRPAPQLTRRRPPCRDCLVPSSCCSRTSRHSGSGGPVIATVLKPLVDLATALVSGFNQLPGPIVGDHSHRLLAAGVVVNVVLGTMQACSRQAWGRTWLRR